MITHLTVAVPKDKVDRSELAKTEPGLKQFEEVTGIKNTRRYDGPTLEMIYSALAKSKISENNLDDIEAVIVVTQSPDRLSPCMAVSVQAILNLPKDIVAFDVVQACNGFITGLFLAQKMVKKTLLICADRLRYSKTPLESLIFSDSVSIAIVKPILSINRFSFYSDGNNSCHLYCGLNGDMDMNGPVVFDFATTTVPNMIKEFNKQSPCDLLIQHQANLSMNKIIEMRSGFKGRSLYSIEEFGNLSMNGVPMTIAHNEEKCLDKELLLCAFGAGFQATTTTIRWPEHPISQIVYL